MKKRLSYCKIPGSTLGCNEHVLTIPDGLKNLAAMHGDKDAFIFVSKDNDRERISWNYLLQKSQSVARALLHLGVKKGDRIAIDLPNCPEWLFLALGAIQAGAIPVGIYSKCKDYSNVINLLKKATNCFMVIIDSCSRTDYWESFKKCLDVIGVDGKVESERFPYLKYVYVRFGGISDMIEEQDRVHDLARFLDANNFDASLPLPELNENDIAFEKQTSGSTGPSKLLTRTHSSITKVLSRQRFVNPSLMLRIKEYNDGNFSWTGGFPISVITGCTRVMLKIDGLTLQERIMNAFRICQQEKCNLFKPTKSMIEYMLAHRDKLPQDWSVSIIYIAGFPLTANIAKLLDKTTRILELMYGAGEFHDLASVRITDPTKFKEYCCGKLIAGVETEIKVVDDDGEIVPVGCRGELLIRGKGVFKEYQSDPERTNAAFTPDGWYKTDDIVMISENEELYVYGRKSNIINCSGIKIDANILERELANYPGVMSVVVVPVPRENLFTGMCGFFHVEENSEITVEDILHFMSLLTTERQAEFKTLPEHVVILNEFPETISGKPQRCAMAKMALEHLKVCCCDTIRNRIQSRLRQVNT